MDNANKTIAIFLALLLTYVLAYCVLLRTEKQPLIGSLGLMSWERSVDYQCGGKAAQRFFSPVNALDRCLRPDYWSGVDEWRSTDLAEILSHTPFFRMDRWSFDERISEQNSELFRPIPLPPRPIRKRERN